MTSHRPIVQGVSDNDGTLYLQDPHGSPHAWAICEEPVEVAR